MRIAIYVVLFLFTAVFADLPEFTAPFYIQANGEDIDIGASMVDPTVADWDGDGIKDLLLGSRNSGRIYYYRNSGINAKPLFTHRDVLRTADGQKICMAHD